MAGAVLIDGGGDALEQVFTGTVHGQLAVIISADVVVVVVGHIGIGKAVAIVFLAAAIAADVAGDGDGSEGGHDQRGIESTAAIVDGVVAAQTITGGILADPGAIVVGTLVAEID